MAGRRPVSQMTLSIGADHIRQSPVNINYLSTTGTPPADSATVDAATPSTHDLTTDRQNNCLGSCFNWRDSRRRPARQQPHRQNLPGLGARAAL